MLLTSQIPSQSNPGVFYIIWNAYVARALSGKLALLTTNKSPYETLSFAIRRPLLMSGRYIADKISQEKPNLACPITPLVMATPPLLRVSFGV